MPQHTNEEIEQAAARFADRAYRLDPETATADRLDDLLAIVTAVDAVVLDEDRLGDAVTIARGSGRSWNLIGVALGASRQAARERFGAGIDHADC